jgi:hypothetical protein
MGISMAEMARRLRAGTSAIELTIRRKNSEEVGKCDNCELHPLSRFQTKHVWELKISGKNHQIDLSPGWFSPLEIQPDFLN